MRTETSRPERLVDEPAGADPRRWRALAILALIQFMLVLDVTVVNVALPRIQHDLGFSRSGLAWVVNGYVLMAGGLLLLGGRLADVYGRRRLFLTGVGVFALASIACGAAGGPAVMVTSRFVQGIGEALAAPASLGLIALLFPDPKERVRALGVWGGVSGIAGTAGTIISGVLTDIASWRWIFYINVPVALVALVMVPRLVSESRMVRSERRPDFTGAILATAGLVAIVDGLLQAATHPWGSSQVLLPLLGGLVLIGVMIAVETRSDSPLIPMEFFTNRTRVVANFVTILNTAAFFPYVFLLTLFEQQVLGYSPLKGGLSYLPLGVGIGLGVGLGTALMSKLGVKRLIAVGFIGVALGLLLTSGIGVDSSYLTGVLPGMLVLGLSSGLIFPALTNASLHGVTGQDSSLASGVQAAVQQIGGALGLACLVTLALRHASGEGRDGVAANIASTNGYALAFRIGAGLLVVGAVLVLALMEHVSAQPANALAGDAEANGSPAGQRVANDDAALPNHS
jgi:EmrB/QacA subfamily drug resistance transporter